MPKPNSRPPNFRPESSAETITARPCLYPQRQDIPDHAISQFQKTVLATRDFLAEFSGGLDHEIVLFELHDLIILKTREALLRGPPTFLEPMASERQKIHRAMSMSSSRARSTPQLQNLTR
jgi:hypothetical protein